MVMRKYRTRLMLASFVFLFIVSLFPLAPASAGPLDSFIGSPIVYWDDDSTDVGITWSPNAQSVTVYNDNSSTGWLEDFNDVSDWTAAGSISAAGGIGSVEGDAWQHAYSNVPSFTSMVGYNITYKVKANKTIAGTRIYGYKADNRGGGYAFYTSAQTLTTSWAVYTEYLPSTPGYSAGALECVSVSAGVNDWTIDLDYIHIYPIYGDLDIGVPVAMQDMQSVEVMGDYSNTSDLVRWEFYSGSTVSHHRIDVNSSHVVFPTATLIGNTAVEHDGVVRLDFDIDNTRNMFMVTAKDEAGSLIDLSRNYYSRAGNDWLRVTASDWAGNFTLYHISGDTNYTRVINNPVWVKTGTEDYADMTGAPGEECVVTQHLLGFNSSCDLALTPDIDHDINYTATFPYLGFLRTEVANFFDITSMQANDFFEWELEIEVNGYYVRFTYNVSDNTYDTYASVKIYNDTTVFYSIENDRYVGLDITNMIYAKLMWWRTQENNIGVMFWGEDIYSSLWTGYSTFDYENWEWDHISGVNETLWISNFTIDQSDWESVNVRLHYEMYIGGASCHPNVMVQYNYFEYMYWMGRGIVQPHFSSTYYDLAIDTGGGVYRPQPIGEPEVIVDVNVWFEFALPEIQLPDILGPLRGFLEGMGNAIGGIAGGLGAAIAAALSTLGQEFVNALVSYINYAVSFWEALLNMVSPGLGTSIVNFIPNLLGMGASLFGLLAGVVTWSLYAVGHIVYWFNWFTTYLMTPQAILMIGLALAIVPLIIANKDGYQAAVSFVWTYYVGAIFAVLGFMYNLVMGFLTLIGNFLPFT